MKVHQPSEAPKSLTLLTVVQGEGKGYGTVRERRVLKSVGGLDDHDDTQQSALALGKGICLPVGTQDVLILIRNFGFSHMYVLRREPNGFAGVLVMPQIIDFSDPSIAGNPDPSQFDVVLKRLR